MKNKRFKIILSILIVFCGISFFAIQFHTKSFNDLLGTNEINITNILMRNGNTGDYVSTTNKDKIKELVNLINNRDYWKSLNQSPRSGYSYYYDFFVGDKHILRIIGDGNNVNVDATYYHVSKAISVDLLNNWFNSLPIKK